VTSGIGGAIFIIGFLLSSILKAYEEAEPIPTALRTARSKPSMAIWNASRKPTSASTSPKRGRRRQLLSAG